MISLEHIRLLQEKVTRAVEQLSTLNEENTLLRSRINTYESRISELENLVNDFKSDQSEIEQGILSALSHLDTLTTAVVELKGGEKADMVEADIEPSTVTLNQEPRDEVIEPVIETEIEIEHTKESPEPDMFEVQTTSAPQTEPEYEEYSNNDLDNSISEDKNEQDDKQLDIF